jgi:hypothetical protein
MVIGKFIDVGHKEMKMRKYDSWVETRNHPRPFYREPAPVIAKRHIVEAPYSILCIMLIFKVNESITYNRYIYIDEEIEQVLSGFPFPTPELVVNTHQGRIRSCKHANAQWQRMHWMIRHRGIAGR